MKKIVQKIEQSLCDFYNLKPDESAKDFLLDEKITDKAFLEFITRKGIDPQRAATLFQLDDDGFLDINIFFSKKLKNSLEENCPLEELSLKNIDAFCALAEEISHFHFIIDHCHRDEPFSLLELEWQGEIDRFLSCVFLLQEQSGSSHYRQLFSLFFEEEYRTHLSPFKERYIEASYLARKYLAKNIPKGLFSMRNTFRASFKEKLTMIRQPA